MSHTRNPVSASNPSTPLEPGTARHSTLESDVPHPNPNHQRLVRASEIYRVVKSGLPEAEGGRMGGFDAPQPFDSDAPPDLSLKQCMDILLNETTARIVGRGIEKGSATVDWIRSIWGPEDAQSWSMLVLEATVIPAEEPEPADEFYLIHGFEFKGELPLEYVWILIEAEGTDGRKGGAREAIKAGWKETGLI